MSTVEKSIRLYAWKANYHIFDIIQDEVLSRHFNIQLMEVSTPVDLTDCRVYFHAEKPDSTTSYIECDVVDRANGKIRVSLTHQIAAVDGCVNCFIQVISESKTDLRFSGMQLNVTECDLTKSAESSSEFPALVKALGEVVPATQRADAATARANQSAENADRATEAAVVAKQNADKATSDANAATKATNEAAEATRQATAEANTATTNANKATVNANTATKNANSAASSASTAAANAEAAASRAGAAADNADATRLATDKSRADAEAATQAAVQATQETRDAITAAGQATQAANGAKDALYAAKENGEFDGYTPVRGLDYFTQTDIDTMMSEIIVRMGGNPVFGVVYPDNTIIIHGILVDGNYSLSYEMENGTLIPIGSMELDSNIYHNVRTYTDNCTNSNVEGFVAAGQKYTASIIALPGYVMSSIKVTMGGVDISSTAVKGATITIEKVTGDVEITAKAVIDTTKPTGNQANPESVDWMTDTRHSASLGSSTCEGSILTNYIRANAGDVIRVKGMKLDGSVNGELARVVCYDRDKNYLNYLVTGIKSTSSSEGAKEQVTVDGDVREYTILMHGDGTQKAKSNTYYVRLSCGLMEGYTANEVIITVNEPIEDTGGVVQPTGGNLADPTSGDWKDDYRISTSAGVKECSGHVTTNFFKVKAGDVLRVKGLSLTTYKNNHSCVAIYKADKTFQNWAVTSSAQSASGDGAKNKVAVSGDISTYTILVLDDGTQRANADTVYCRIDGTLISGYTKNDVVITINEEIA